VSISLLVPTRNRPVGLRRLVESARKAANVNYEDPEIVAYIDADDTQSQSVAEDLKIKFVVGPRIILSDMWNKCAEIATGEILAQLNDDCIFQTDDWNAIIENEFGYSPRFSDRISMVHGSDGGPSASTFAVNPFVHREWVDTLGYFMPPYFSGDYPDTWINDLANALNRRVFLPFLIEHMHPAWGKAEKDETFLDRLKRDARDCPDRFYRTLQQMRNLDIWKLRRRISGEFLPKKRWSILILTQASRAGYLHKLLNVLVPQVRNLPEVDVEIRVFDNSMDLGANRQAMIDKCEAEYVSFVDDDDLVSENYVSMIYPFLLGGIDMVGFRVYMTFDGVPQKPVIHSLACGGWREDGAAYYRDISHLNPMRRELVKQVPLEGGFGEDARWAAKMRELGIVRTEHFIDQDLYHYLYRTKK
jgi:glycosyltransferase involved in cell wall biosynthesis